MESEQPIKNIYFKLQQLRVLILEKSLKKSGRNNHSKYSYYEMEDFLPQTTLIMRDLGITSLFNIETDSQGREWATLDIYNMQDGERVSFQYPTAEVFIGSKDGKGGAQPIQNLGGKTTYMKRYLFINALDLTETDTVENDAQKAPKVEVMKDEDLSAIEQTKTFEDLLVVCGGLKEKYSNATILPYFQYKKIKIEQDAQ